MALCLVLEFNAGYGAVKALHAASLDVDPSGSTVTAKEHSDEGCEVVGPLRSPADHRRTYALSDQAVARGDHRSPGRAGIPQVDDLERNYVRRVPQLSPKCYRSRPYAVFDTFAVLEEPCSQLARNHIWRAGAVARDCERANIVAALSLLDELSMSLSRLLVSLTITNFKERACDYPDAENKFTMRSASPPSGDVRDELRPSSLGGIADVKA